MIERHVTFNVYPDKKEEFEKLFVEDYRPAMAVMPGFVTVDLLCQLDEPSQHQMVIRFESSEAAADWRSSAAHHYYNQESKRYTTIANYKYTM